MTANRALNELTAGGFLARVPGVGTFVKEPRARSSLLELRNIAEEIGARGHTHSAEIEAADRVMASAALAEEFEMGASELLYHLVLVHKDNGVPVELEERYVNPALAPRFLDQDFTRVMPTGYLLDAIPVDELEHTVEALMPSPAQRRLLDVARDVPCLALHRRSWSGGQVVTVATLLYPGNRYALHSRYRTGTAGSIEGRS
jgi:GntR family histidine utilization transcriptional repressor